MPTTPRSLPIADPMAAAQVQQLTDNCREFGIPLHGLGSPNQGIVHVIGPQLGLTQPGMTIVCGDSHTATHGAFGALAFGIGTSEVEMVLATQTLLQRRPKTYEVRVDGRLAPGVCSEGRDPRPDRADRRRRRDRPRLRVPRRGDPRPDDGTADDHLQHVDRGRRPGRPDRAGRHDVRVRGGPAARAAGRRLGRGGRALADAPDRRRRALRQLDHDRRDRPRADGHVRHEPRDGHPDHVPRPLAGRPGRRASRRALERALEYMDLRPGQPILGQKVDVVFVGSLHERPDQRPPPRRRAS